ncbi:hypothetical protein [Streptomyces sp. S.PNR 29]|uniref:effector-associated constant component EACC1 n=1 Tax=Streptomyces sp. S.PNR 29 TaxID=2973805 RepID=UPI0025B0C91F|nr:hypothetical protein [Streptomyces sp. S.PNR 29]MDN0196957.1 hypothetical protein [Streptomyces sp. S.PNR 29]
MTEVRVGISVDGTTTGAGGHGTVTDTGLHDLRRRLATEPELRGRIRLDGSAPLPPGAMGFPGEALLALLEPGGVVTTFAAGLVAWLAARRTECTVTVTRPDGTQITVTSTRVRNLTAQERAEFIREITAALDESAPEPE